MNKGGKTMTKTVVFQTEEYARLCEVVGSLMVSQFNGDQEAYRQTINEIFAEFATPSDPA